jgi:hypothetical protein
MLYYPTFYEGLEQSKNVIYTGQEATQQILCRPELGQQDEKGEDVLPDRLGLHLAAHLEQDRAQAHREPSARAARSSAKNITRSADPVQLAHQQDQADQARRDLRRSSSAARTSRSTSS